MTNTIKRTAVTGIAVALVGTGASVATASSANADVWDRVAACESGGNWGISTGNGFHGGLQFTPSTWRAYGGSGSAASASKAEQIRVAKKVLAGQGPGAWPVCSRKAGLTRGNGGATSGSVESSRSTTRTKVATKHTVAKVKATKTTKAKVAKTTKVTPVRTHTSAVRTFTTPAKTTKAAVAPSLRLQVKTIQRELDVRVDGIVGPQTARAIQKYVGVTQDGVIGPKTVAAIEKKVGLKASGATTLRPSRINALAHFLATN